MRILIFCHSLFSDWNHGNAHFLRGITSEMLLRGIDVRVYEPLDAWSMQNLLAEYGDKAIKEFQAAYPHLHSVRYDRRSFDLDAALDGADLVLVHEWNDPALVQRIGKHRARVGGYRLLFHDTHHRSVTDKQSMSQYDLSDYDGVLAFGKVIRDIYLDNHWANRAWTWHEAADVHVFKPIPSEETETEKAHFSAMNQMVDEPKSSPYNLPNAIGGDVVWIGNWGDEERSFELKEFLIDPVKDLHLQTRIYGVRYPQEAKRLLREAEVEYAGWLPNYVAPQVFAHYKVTVHVPRRPYAEALPGIPTIRVFEALACGIPLVSAPWDDAENLFTSGADFLVARSGKEMRAHLRTLISDDNLRHELSTHGRQTILARHTCAHRVDELLTIYSEMKK